MFTSGCGSVNKNITADASDKEMEITGKVYFNVFNENIKPLTDADILLINSNGIYIDTLNTDEKGEAQREITVPIDKRYGIGKENGSNLRGTITAIIKKTDYIDKLLFEVPVSDAGAVQVVNMHPVIEGSKNEPEVMLGYNRQNEIMQLVDKYKEFFKEK